MIPALLRRLHGRVTLVVGKGGVGKTTAAGGVALALADSGAVTHLLSTDPAHSLGDLFRVDAGPAPAASPCTDRLVLEELDAESLARGRLGGMEPALRQLIDRGTYLDEDDAASLLGGSLPGLDEIGAALRVAELAAEDGPPRLVLDTAPTGHTLRLLDVPATLEAWLRVFRAMAEKADVVASALVGRRVRLEAEDALDALRDDLDGFRNAVRDADFIVVGGPGELVRKETARLVAELERRRLRVAATVAVARAGAEADLLLPFRPGLGGCDAIRDWIRATTLTPAPTPGAAARASPAAGTRAGGGARAFAALDRELIVFAGKGGVGKTTSAAAAAVRLVAEGPVSLQGVDPAGSLADVLGPDAPPGLTVRELDAERELERLRDLYREEVAGVFEAVGLEQARLDREVIESLWGLAPPGIDEVVAVARLADEAEPGHRIVLDTAPTGHFLRLMAMPQLALDWTHRIMRILLKYRALGSLDAPAEPLLRFARRLRSLRERLADPGRTAIVLVTLDEPMVRAETQRLAGRLGALGLAPAAVLVNRAARAEPLPGVPTIRAPEVPEPVGAERLRALAAAWECVA